MKKVVLLGDSIRQGYEKYVGMAFEEAGTAQIYSPDDCCRFASYMLRNVAQWKGEMGCGSDVDLIHWNAGLWDCLHMLDGRPHTDLEVYQDYLTRIHTVLNKLFPGAKQIFATSTAVIEEGYTGIYKRLNNEIEYYNAAAVATLEPLGVQINDLHTLTCNIPEQYHSDMTHFNTKEGTQLLANQVICCIENALHIRGQALDYDALFAKQTEIVGI